MRINDKRFGITQLVISGQDILRANLLYLLLVLVYNLVHFHLQPISWHLFSKAFLLMNLCLIIKMFLNAYDKAERQADRDTIHQLNFCLRLPNQGRLFVELPFRGYSQSGLCCLGAGSAVNMWIVVVNFAVDCRYSVGVKPVIALKRQKVRVSLKKEFAATSFIGIPVLISKERQSQFDSVEVLAGGYPRTRLNIRVSSPD